jgi:hypothetical protein
MTCLGGGCARGGGGGGRPEAQDPEGRQQSLRYGAMSSPGSRPAQQALQVRLFFPQAVKYGDRSPKFILAPFHVMCTAVLIGRAPATPLPPSPGIGTCIRGRYRSAKIDDISL